MHNSEKYPEIWKAKEKAEAELKVLQAKRKAHTDKINAIGKGDDPFSRASLKEKERLNDLAMADYARIKELSTDIARLATAMGAIVASNSAKRNT